MEVPICPSCGEEVSDEPWMDFPSTGKYDTECGNCGAHVAVTANVAVDYTVALVESD
jgi:transcription elongation factor Elf1